MLAAGRHQMAFCTQAAMMGGNVRVGLEDSLFIGRGKLATSNAEQVAKIRRIVEEYAHAQDAHRVLTEDVKFLTDEDRQRVLDKERLVVAGFARALADTRHGEASAQMAKPLTMLLFGMINWMFTWMKPDGELDYDAMGPIVADLFLGGVGNVKTPPAVSAPKASRRTRAA